MYLHSDQGQRGRQPLLIMWQAGNRARDPPGRQPGLTTFRPDSALTGHKNGGENDISRQPLPGRPCLPPQHPFCAAHPSPGDILLAASPSLRSWEGLPKWLQAQCLHGLLSGHVRDTHRASVHFGTGILTCQHRRVLAAFKDVAPRKGSLNGSSC